MKTADAVVIGGGINGCSIAYRLARNGLKNVVLVEKRHVASGPTGRSSGVVRQHYSLETLAKMARDSVRIFENFTEEIGGEAGFVQCGVAYCCPASAAGALRTVVDMHHRLGIRESILNSGDLKELEPALCLDGIACGAYEPDGGYADPALAANSFCEAARMLGVDVMTRTSVTGLAIENGRITAVDTDQGSIATGVAINVAGPWGAGIAAMAGARIPITPTRHPVVILQRPPAWKSRTPVWADLVNGWYFKPEGTGGLMVGSIGEMDDTDRADIDNHATTPGFDEIERYAEAALRRFPVMIDGAAQGGWAGLYDLTPDSHPVIDRIAGVEGFYCAVGFSGHGFKIAPAIGIAVAELVLNGRSESYDLTPFRYERFQDGCLTRGAYEYSILG